MSGRDAFETWSTAPVQMAVLVAFTDGGATPLVLDPSLPGAPARRARTVVDLCAEHLGRQVVLLFEAGNPARPIVVGVLRDSAPADPGHLTLASDGERILITAGQQLVLRCGKASITLTRAGKVLVEGAYILSKSTGVNRMKGGSVQLN